MEDSGSDGETKKNSKIFDTASSLLGLKELDQVVKDSIFDKVH
jgi:hypothetical protein